MKRTHSIIDQHQSFFDSLKEVRKIVILGHSLSDVDMPYFDKIAESIMKDQVEWEISYHTQEDINRIHHFCKRYGISAQPTLL
jgi:flavorubredoxin